MKKKGLVLIFIAAFCACMIPAMVAMALTTAEISIPDVTVGETVAVNVSFKLGESDSEPSLSYLSGVSSNESVATVNGKYVTGVSPGTAEITFTVGVEYMNQRSGCDDGDIDKLEHVHSYKTKVTVLEAGDFVLHDITLNLSESIQARLSGDVPPGEGSWSVADASIASVDENGLVTGLRPGGTALYYTVGNTRADAQINVNSIEISLAPEAIYLRVDETTKVSVVFPDYFTGDKTGVWESNYDNVIVDEDGNVTLGGRIDGIFRIIRFTHTLTGADATARVYMVEADAATATPTATSTATTPKSTAASAPANIPVPDPVPDPAPAPDTPSIMGDDTIELVAGYAPETRIYAVAGNSSPTLALAEDTIGAALALQADGSYALSIPAGLAQGSYSVVLTANNGGVTAQKTVTVTVAATAQAPSIAVAGSIGLVEGYANAGVPFTVSGYPTPALTLENNADGFALSGNTLAIPAGLKANVVQPKSYTVDIVAQNSVGADRKTVTVNVYPAITLVPTNINPAIKDKPYFQAFTGAGGAGGPYTMSIASGSLPAGLSLTAAGELAGTPTVAGDYSFTIHATDSKGLYADFSYTLQVDVNEDNAVIVPGSVSIMSMEAKAAPNMASADETPVEERTAQTEGAPDTEPAPGKINDTEAHPQPNEPAPGPTPTPQQDGAQETPPEDPPPTPNETENEWETGGEYPDRPKDGVDILPPQEEDDSE